MGREFLGRIGWGEMSVFLEVWFSLRITEGYVVLGWVWLGFVGLVGLFFGM